MINNFFFQSNGSDNNTSLNKKSAFDEGVTLAWDNLSIFVNVKKRGRMDVKRIINCGMGLNMYSLKISQNTLSYRSCEARKSCSYNGSKVR